MPGKVTIALLMISVCWTASAQTGSWDSSGNGLLSGTYYFRHVLWGDTAGEVGRALSAYGTITFTPVSGTYTMNAQTYDSVRRGSSLPSSITGITGAYSISAGGYGFMDNALSIGDSLVGLVGKNGVFIGSSTENQGSYNDLFIAAPIGSTQATVAAFNGNYAIMDLDDPGVGLPNSWQYAQNVLMTVHAQGDGSLGTVALSGYVGGSSTAMSQSVSGVHYTFSSGAGNISFPSSTINLVSGNHVLYISPDGSFVFGGSPNGWDMFVGVRTGSGIPNFSGLYYQAGMDVSLGYIDEYGTIDLDGYYGSFKATDGLILGHQRFGDQVNGKAYDYNYTDSYTINSDGSSDSAYLGQHHIFSADGTIRIGLGNFGSPVIGISVALQAPAFSGTGLTLDPTGIANTASSALFTASIAPGQLLTLYGAAGSTLANGAARDASFPTILNGVQVKINGISAPILEVNECGARPCITVMVPYEIQGLYVQIQAISGGKSSNTIVGFAGSSAPGLFTIPAGGVGHVAAQHVSNFAAVTTSNPAEIGETIAVYLTGLGGMSPAVGDAAPGPSVLANAVESVWAFIGGVQAAVSFAGLTPGVIGLAQINLVVPSGVTPGDNNIDIATCPIDCSTSGFDSYTSEALITISGSSVAGTPPTIPFSRRAQRANRPPLLRKNNRAVPSLRVLPRTSN
jgi:uncharacterized protein (TIGR03437 family)